MKHNLARERLSTSAKPSNLIRDLQLFPTFRTGHLASAYSRAHFYNHNRCGPEACTSNRISLVRRQFMQRRVVTYRH